MYCIHTYIPSYLSMDVNERFQLAAALIKARGSDAKLQAMERVIEMRLLGNESGRLHWLGVLEMVLEIETGRTTMPIT